MGKPMVPDLIAAQQQQGQINRNTALDLANQNRYTQVGPAGDTNVWDAATNTNTTTMGQRPQAYYNALMDTGTAATNSFASKYYGGGGGGGAAAGGGSIGVNLPSTALGKIPGNIQNDLDYSNLTAMPTTDPAAARQQAQDALYGRATGYLDPQWQQTEDSTRTRLANQGLVPGTPAYDRAYANEARAKEQAYTGARQDAIAGGGAEAERAQAMALALRNQGVTEAGNLGAFHNAAQEQRARQYLTDLTSKRSADATLGAAGISAGASMSNNASDNALRLRAQEYAESTGFGNPAQAFLPQFGISQGNVGAWKPEDIAGATQDQFTDAMARYTAKKPPSFLQQIALAATGNAGQAARAYAGGGGSGMPPATGGTAP